MTQIQGKGAHEPHPLRHTRELPAPPAAEAHAAEAKQGHPAAAHHGPHDQHVEGAAPHHHAPTHDHEHALNTQAAGAAHSVGAVATGGAVLTALAGLKAHAAHTPHVGGAIGHASSARNLEQEVVDDASNAKEAYTTVNEIKAPLQKAAKLAEEHHELMSTHGSKLVEDVKNIRTVAPDALKNARQTLADKTKALFSSSKDPKDFEALHASAKLNGLFTGLALFGAGSGVIGMGKDVVALARDHGKKGFVKHTLDFGGHLGDTASNLPTAARGLGNMALVQKLLPAGSKAMGALEWTATSPLMRGASGLGSICAGLKQCADAHKDMAAHGSNFGNTLAIESGAIKAAGGTLMMSKLGYPLGVGLTLTAGALDGIKWGCDKTGLTQKINHWQTGAAESLSHSLFGAPDVSNAGRPIKLPPRPAGGWAHFLQTHSPQQVNAFYKAHGVT